MITCATSTDTTFNAPDLQDAPDYTVSDMREARGSAFNFIAGNKNEVYDVITNESLQLDNLAEILAALNVCNNHVMPYLVLKLRKEFLLKMSAQIDARYEVELESLYD